MSTRPQEVQAHYKKHIDNDREDTDMPRRTMSYKWVLQIAVSAVSGFLFGLAMEKGRVFEPHIIREQMLFSNFTMLKMFLSASAAGMLSLSLLSMIPATSKQFEAAVDDFAASLASKSVPGAAVGGALLGCGMTLAGSCPGMVFTQVGAAVPYAVVTLAGGLCGAYLYALTEPVVSDLIQPSQPAQYYTLDEYSGSPYFILALPLAAVLGMVVFTVELLRPWTSEVEMAGSGIMGSRAWPPFMAGLLIGSLQIPAVLFLEDTLGSTKAFMTVASQALVVKNLQSVFPHLEKFRTGVANWWQVSYLSSAVIGAYLSSSASGTVGLVSGVEPWYNFFGGVLMVYGSRLAGGCSSGHGLSGMALLMLLSFVAVPAMFAGGISTAAVMKYVLSIDI